MIKFTEHTIINGCKAKDPVYQKELVLRFSPMLMAISRRYCADSSIAKDVLQDSLIKIINGINSYKHVGSFEGWMKKIVVNTALQRKVKKLNKYEIYGFEKLPEVEITPIIYNQLNAEELLSIIDRLPDGYRNIFNLYAIEGYSHAEIGIMLGISESTSRSQLSRTRQYLQKLLRKEKKISI